MKGDAHDLITFFLGFVVGFVLAWLWLSPSFVAVVV